MKKKRNPACFKKSAKDALAARANHKCSICNRGTSGPQEGAEDGSVSIGEAAHIHAASKGGPRYLKSMSPNECSRINNGIWLCRLCHTLIDRDYKNYPPERLLKIKKDHEAKISQQLQSNNFSVSDIGDFIQLGPDIIFWGNLKAQQSDELEININQFFIGDFADLYKFINDYSELLDYEKFVLFNELGKGRELTRTPRWEEKNSKITIYLKVKKENKRIDINELLYGDIATDDTGDIAIIGKRISLIKGKDYLPQLISRRLSFSYNESFMDKTINGTKIKEYLKEYFNYYSDTNYFIHLIKLEIIRLSCIRTESKDNYPPLKSVLEVKEVKIISPILPDKTTKLELELDIEGLGLWKGDILIYGDGKLE